MASSEKSSSSAVLRSASIPFQDPAGARQNLEKVSSKLSPALASALPALLAESPDPDSALLLLDRLLSESPESLHLLENHPFLTHYAITVFAHSRYLGETLVRNSDLL